MIRGYIRVSTKRQEYGTSLDEQRQLLEAEGCQKFYEDVITGTKMQRPEFDRMCHEVQSGDMLVFTKMDRFARTETEAYEKIQSWMQQGIKVRILNIGAIEDTEVGRLILEVVPIKEIW